MAGDLSIPVGGRITELLQRLSQGYRLYRLDVLSKAAAFGLFTGSAIFMEPVIGGSGRELQAQACLIWRSGLRQIQASHFPDGKALEGVIATTPHTR